VNSRCSQSLKRLYTHLRAILTQPPPPELLENKITPIGNISQHPRALCTRRRNAQPHTCPQTYLGARQISCIIHQYPPRTPMERGGQPNPVRSDRRRRPVSTQRLRKERHTSAAGSITKGRRCLMPEGRRNRCDIQSHPWLLPITAALSYGRDAGDITDR
jgi:hypothetical protein